VTDATEGRPTTTDHKDLGRSLNGLVWRLLARNDRTAEDDARMVDAAHASQYHGREAGGPPGTRGRVADFDHAYAAEAMARALACAGDLDQAAAWHARATAAGAGIADDEDREIFTGDLATGPWFGLRTG
jgi:hypothetical protein